MDIGIIVLYFGIMLASDFQGKMVVNVNGISFPLAVGGGTVIEAVHASWCFQAMAENKRHEHVHQVFHLVAVSRGRGSFLHSGQTLSFDGPALFLVSPGVRHTFSVLNQERVEYHELTFTLRGAEAPHDWETLNETFFGSTGALPVQMPETASVATPFPVPLYPDENAGALISDLTLRVVEGLAGTKPSPGLPHYLQTLIALACELVRSSANPVANDTLSRAKDYIERHFTEHFSLAQLAALSGYSPKHLCRAFTARFGTAPFEYKRSLAMKSAEQLLAMTTYPIKQVAEAVGYPDLYHFSKIFSAWTGMPPGRFRAQNYSGASPGIVPMRR